MVIQRESISRIVRRPEGDLIIRAAGYQQIIVAPRELENLAELQAELSTWHAIEDEKEGRTFLKLMAILVPWLAVIVTALVATDPRIVVPAAAVVGILMPVFSFLTFRSSHFDRRTRIGLLVFLPMIELMVAARIFLSLNHYLGK